MEDTFPPHEAVILHPNHEADYRPIQIEVDKEHRPVAFVWHCLRRTVAEVLDEWREIEPWWEQDPPKRTESPLGKGFGHPGTLRGGLVFNKNII